MGIWGNIKEKFKSAGRKVKEKCKSVGRKVARACTNMWNKFSGKDTFKEAEELYEKMSNKYNRHKRKFDEELERYIDSIEKHVERINSSKEIIKTDLFVRMAENMEKIHDVVISEDFTIESYKQAVLSFDSVRDKEALYKIDFNKHKFKTSIQAFFTLGFILEKKQRKHYMLFRRKKEKLIMK